MDLNWPVKQVRLWFLKVPILLKTISGEVKPEKTLIPSKVQQQIADF